MHLIDSAAPASTHLRVKGQVLLTVHHVNPRALDANSVACVSMQVVVDFGSAFCHHCKEMLPHFLSASREVLLDRELFAIAVTCKA